MRKFIITLFAGLALTAGASSAYAGCLGGAAVGGVGGHFVGHGHAVLGAVAGCAVGHHMAKKKDEQQRQEALNRQRYQQQNNR